jgi:hypothetical protein
MSPKHAVAALGVVVLAVPAVAAGARIVPHGTYKGETSQADNNGIHAQIQFTVAKSHRKVAKLAFQARVDCDSGTPQLFTLPGHDEKIDHKGRFSDSGTVKGTADGNRPATLTAVLHGRFTSARKAVGTFSATEEISDASGNVVDHCRSGNVTWTAKR